jgi:dUTP pyrophosphatase
MRIKVKKLHPDAVIPTYAKAGDAGMDLYATEMEWDDHGNSCYCTGLSLEIPAGYVGLIFPRSSISKTPHTLRNSVGVIDSGYRGEVMVKFGGNSSAESYKKGDRIAQVMILPYPKIHFVESQDLSESERGSGGFGSTGNS